MTVPHALEHTTISAQSNSSISEYDPRLLPAKLRRFRANPETGHWLWLGPPTSGGHGQVRIDGETKTAHRAVYEFFHGPCAPGITVHHTCDIRLCVNPEHQAEKDGNRHRADHCREKWAQQKANPESRLIGPRPNTRPVSEAERAEMVHLYDGGRGLTQQQIAEHFGRSRHTVHKFVAPAKKAAAA